MPRLPSPRGSYKVAAYPAFHIVTLNLDPVSATVCDLEPSTFGRTAYSLLLGEGPDLMFTPERSTATISRCVSLARTEVLFA